MKLNKKGFTLIELLAVIVILGVIMLIAIPSVSSIISNSRANTLKSTAQTLISGARNLVLASPSGTPEVGDDDAGSNKPWRVVTTTNGYSGVEANSSYIIRIEDIDVESGSNTESPYGVPYDQDYSFIIAVADDAGNYTYHIQLFDTNGNNIPFMDEETLQSSDSVVGSADSGYKNAVDEDNNKLFYSFNDFIG